MAADMERLIPAMARYITAHGGSGEFSDLIIDVVLETIEEKKREHCESCGLSIMGHSIQFFEGRITHNFDGAVR